MSASNQKLYMIAGVLALALIIGIAIYMRGKKSEDEEDYATATTPPRPIYVDKNAKYNPITKQWQAPSQTSGQFSK